MSSEPPHESIPIPIRTLADVVDAVRAADLPKQRRQEISAALRTAARAIGKPLDRVPADPRRLAALLSEVSPIALGLSPGRWANVRSLTRAGLALVQPMAPGRHITPLSPGWKALWQQLPRKVTQAAIPICTILLGSRHRARWGAPTETSKRFVHISTTVC